MNHPQIIAKAGSDTADLYIYEPIMANSAAGGKSISQQLAALEGKGKLRVFINSPGGSVMEGIAIYNLLQRTTMEVTMYVDGVAASMAAVLTQVPGAKVYMSRHAKLMLHNVKGAAQGNAADMRSMAALMDEFASDLVNIVAARTGASPEEVNARWFDGKDHWLNAEQALEAKLIDGIVDGKLKITPPKSNNATELHSYYTQQILNHQIKQQMEQITQVLGLAAEATEQQVVDHVNTVLAQVTDLQGQVTARDATIAEMQGKLDAVHKNKISEMINNAVQAGKITAEMKPTYEKLAASDFDATKAVLNAIPAYKTIAGQLDKETIPEARKDWSFKDWQSKDGKGLMKLRDEQPEVYSMLYEKEFGKKPKTTE